MNDQQIRLSVQICFTALIALALFAIFRIFVPGLINMQNDGALILGVALAIAAPVTSIIALFIIWNGETA